MISMPMKRFSPHTPYFTDTEWSSSDSSGNGSEYLALNFVWLFAPCPLTPRTTAFLSWMTENSSRKPHACAVHPGVSSLG